MVPQNRERKASLVNLGSLEQSRRSEKTGQWSTTRDNGRRSMVWNRKTPGHGGRTTDHKSAQWGGVNYGKPTAEFNAHNQKVMVETIEACELVRKRTTNSVPMKLVEILLNQRKPFESITILRANCNKQDFGMLIERCVDLLDLPTKQPP